MAAVLLRRLLSSSFEEIYPGLTLEMQTAIKAELLTSIQQATSPNIRKKVCDIAAELCRNLIGKAGLNYMCEMPSGCISWSESSQLMSRLRICLQLQMMTGTTSGQSCSSSCSTL